MADKHFLSNTEAAKLLANAERDKSKAIVIDPIAGHVPKWPTQDHYATMLSAVEFGASSVVLDISYVPTEFQISYYEGSRESGRFFIMPTGHTFVPCGWFNKNDIRTRIETDKVEEDSDADRINQLH